MPGARLTSDDRERIARGLAAGLDYAQIARKLGRPTSTITREIARNGGPHAYEPDRAQRATVHRARRRTAPAPVEPANAHGRDPAAVMRFVDELAGAMAQAGVPRMPARVLSCLLATDAGCLTAAELAARLRVSPASVSKAVNYLEQLGLLRRERELAGRRERYSVHDDVWTGAWTTSARAHATWAEAANRGTEILGLATPAGERMAAMSAFFATLSNTMSGTNPTPPGSNRVTEDALTAIAALAHSHVPLTAHALAHALTWPTDRAARALRHAERLAAHTDPIVVERVHTETYVLTASPNRLDRSQRRALGSANTG